MMLEQPEMVVACVEEWFEVQLREFRCCYDEQ